MGAEMNGFAWVVEVDGKYLGENWERVDDLCKAQKYLSYMLARYAANDATRNDFSEPISCVSIRKVVRKVEFYGPNIENAKKCFVVCVDHEGGVDGGYWRYIAVDGEYSVMQDCVHGYLPWKYAFDLKDLDAWAGVTKDTWVKLVVGQEVWELV